MGVNQWGIGRGCGAVRGCQSPPPPPHPPPLSLGIYPTESPLIFYGQVDATTGLTSTRPEGFPDNLFGAGSVATLRFTGVLRLGNGGGWGGGGGGGGGKEGTKAHGKSQSQSSSQSRLLLRCESTTSLGSYGGDSIITQGGAGVPVSLRVVEEVPSCQGGAVHGQGQGQVGFLDENLINSVRLLSKRTPPCNPLGAAGPGPTPGGGNKQNCGQPKQTTTKGYREAASNVDWGYVVLRAEGEKRGGGGGGGGGGGSGGGGRPRRAWAKGAPVGWRKRGRTS